MGEEVEIRLCVFSVHVSKIADGFGSAAQVRVLITKEGRRLTTMRTFVRKLMSDISGDEGQDIAEQHTL